MELEQQLKRYGGNKSFRETLGIPQEAAIEFTLLAQGEYNINYKFTHPVNGKQLLLRVNTGSQMRLKHQIEYEYDALKGLEVSGRTPKVYYVDGSPCDGISSGNSYGLSHRSYGRCVSSC
jgi:hypothetical protein